MPVCKHRTKHLVEHSYGNVSQGRIVCFAGGGDGGPVFFEDVAGGLEEGVEGSKCLAQQAFALFEFLHRYAGDELYLDIPGGLPLLLIYFPFAFYVQEGEVYFEGKTFKFCVCHSVSSIFAQVGINIQI